MIDLDKLQALREKHERMRTDYATRAELARFGSAQIERLRADLAVGVKSDAALALISTDPAALLKYPADKLRASNVSIRTLRQFVAALASLSTARDEASDMAAMVRDSAALLERLEKFAPRHHREIA